MDRHEVRYRANPRTAVDHAPAGSGLLDVEGVALRLGVTARHVRRLVAERRIPFIKWGHLLRFEPADVERWIAEQRIEALPPRRGSRSGTVR
jgi:excisionase family DNA binding protein